MNMYENAKKLVLKKLVSKARAMFHIPNNRKPMLAFSAMQILRERNHEIEICFAMHLHCYMRFKSRSMQHCSPA